MNLDYVERFGLKISLTRWFVDYLNKTKNFSTGRFIVELTFITFALKVLFVFIFAFIFVSLGLDTTPDLEFEESLARQNLAILVVSLAGFAAFETVTAQWFIPFLVSLFSKRVWLQVLISAIIFAILHYPPLFSIVTIFPIGIILAWSFLRFKSQSRWKAFWVTTIIHLIHNLIANAFIRLSF